MVYNEDNKDFFFLEVSMLKFARFLFCFLFWILLIEGIATVVLGIIKPDLLDGVLTNVSLGGVVIEEVSLLTLGISIILMDCCSVLPLYCVVAMACEVKKIRRQLAAMPKAAPVNTEAQPVANSNPVGYHVIKLD